MATIALVCRLLLHTSKLVDRFVVGAAASSSTTTMSCDHSERLSLTRSAVIQPAGDAGDTGGVVGGGVSACDYILPFDGSTRAMPCLIELKDVKLVLYCMPFVCESQTVIFLPPPKRNPPTPPLGDNTPPPLNSA